MTRLLFLLAVLALAPASAQPTAPSPPQEPGQRTASGRGTGAAASVGADAATPNPDPLPAAPVIVAPVQKTAETPTGPFGGLGLPILVGALLLAALVGLAAFVTRRKRQAEGSRGGSARGFNQAPPAGPRVQSGATEAVPKPAEPLATRAEHEALAARVARIEQRVFEQPRVAAPPVQDPQSAPVQAPPQSVAAGVAAGVAASFASWCRVGGGLVDRHELFQSHLSNTLPDAAVEVVKRDLDSPARPIAFDAVGGNSAAAYWLVRAGSELLLFPQPQSPQQFRDLAPAFAGSAAPQTLTAVEPARVSASGGGYVLTQPGRIA